MHPGTQSGRGVHFFSLKKNQDVLILHFNDCQTVTEKVIILPFATCVTAIFHSP